MLPWFHPPLVGGPKVSVHVSVQLSAIDPDHGVGLTPSALPPSVSHGSGGIFPLICLGSSKECPVKGRVCPTVSTVQSSPLSLSCSRTFVNRSTYHWLFNNFLKVNRISLFHFLNVKSFKT